MARELAAPFSFFFFFRLKSHRANLSRDVSSNRASEIFISIRVLYICIYTKIRNDELVVNSSCSS